jgi:hypothetical protein
MGMIAPMLHGNLTLLAWISMGLGGCGWLAWRAGTAARNVR